MKSKISNSITHQFCSGHIFSNCTVDVYKTGHCGIVFTGKEKRGITKCSQITEKNKATIYSYNLVVRVNELVLCVSVF